MTTNPRSPAIDTDNRRLICEICIEWVGFDDLYRDDNGDAWDVCRECGEKIND